MRRTLSASEVKWIDKSVEEYRGQLDMMLQHELYKGKDRVMATMVYDLPVSETSETSEPVEYNSFILTTSLSDEEVASIVKQVNDRPKLPERWQA